MELLVAEACEVEDEVLLEVGVLPVVEVDSPLEVARVGSRREVEVPLEVVLLEAEVASALVTGVSRPEVDEDEEVSKQEQEEKKEKKERKKAKKMGRERERERRSRSKENVHGEDQKFSLFVLRCLDDLSEMAWVSVNETAGCESWGTESMSSPYMLYIYNLAQKLIIGECNHDRWIDHRSGPFSLDSALCHHPST